MKNASYISTKKEEIAPIYNKLNRNSQNYFKIMAQYNILNAFQVVGHNSGADLNPFTLPTLLYDNTRYDVVIYTYNPTNEKCKSVLEVTFVCVFLVVI